MIVRQIVSAPPAREFPTCTSSVFVAPSDRYSLMLDGPALTVGSIITGYTRAASESHFNDGDKV